MSTIKEKKVSSFLKMPLRKTRKRKSQLCLKSGRGGFLGGALLLVDTDWSIAVLLGQSLGHVFVGQLNLSVSSAGVGELVPRVGVLQVAPHARHVGGDVVVAVLLRHNLRRGGQAATVTVR